MTEPDMIARAQQGDADAWAALYARYAPLMERYLIKRTGRADVDDLLSELWLRTFSRLASYEDRGFPFSSWLYRIAEGLVVDEWRYDKRRRTIPIEPGHAVIDGPEAWLERWDERAAELGQALNRLSDAQRQVVQLRFYGDKSLDETAAALGMGKAAVKALQHRGIAGLGRALRKDAS